MSKKYVVVKVIEDIAEINWKVCNDYDEAYNLVNQDVHKYIAEDDEEYDDYEIGDVTSWVRNGHCVEWRIIEVQIELQLGVDFVANEFTG